MGCGASRQVAVQPASPAVSEKAPLAVQLPLPSSSSPSQRGFGTSITDSVGTAVKRVSESPQMMRLSAPLRASSPQLRRLGTLGGAMADAVGDGILKGVDEVNTAMNDSAVVVQAMFRGRKGRQRHEVCFVEKLIETEKGES